MKGMQAISRGSGFGGTVKYGLVNENGDLDGRIIGGNMSGTTAQELSKEFGLSRKLRPDVKKPVWHNTLRSPKDEKLTDEEFMKIGDDYMKRMGFKDSHQRVYIMHDDEKGRHIHIVSSRIGLDGELYLGKNENLKSTKIIQKLERDYGLVRTKGPDNVRGDLVMPDAKRPTQGEVGKFARTGEAPERFALAELIDKAIADKPTATTFAERLTLSGVEVRANFNKNGLNGFSFSLNGIPFKGSQLGKQYTGQALLERGLTYVKDRDHAYLSKLSPAAEGDGKHDRPAPSAEGVQPLSADRAVDSAAARDTIDIRRTPGGADRADHRADHADPRAIAGRVERSADERRDVETSAEASRDIGSEAGASIAGTDAESPIERPGAGAESPGTSTEKTAAAAVPAVARPSEHSHQSHGVGDGIGTGVEISSAGLITTGDKGTDELLQAAHSGRLKAEREVLSRQKKQHAEDMANSKKRQAELDKPHTSRLSTLADRSIDSAWRAIEMQRFASALGAGKFQVTCTPANAKAETIKKTYTAADLQDPKVIKNLSHLAARNYTVSVQPSDSAGMILLKGLDAQDIKKLEAIGLGPAAVVSFAGKNQAWIATGSQMSSDERKALTKRIEGMVGVDKAAGSAGRLVGFSGASLTAGTGQVAPAAAELLGEIKSEIFEAKAAARLAKAIEKEVVIKDRDYDDIGGIKSLRKGLLNHACHAAEAEATFFGGKYDPAVVERGVLEAMARQGVEPRQAYRAMFEESWIGQGNEEHAAHAVAQAYTRALAKDGQKLSSEDLATESAKRYPELIKRAESRQDSELKAIHERGKAEGIVESARLAKEAEERAIKIADEAAKRKAQELEDGVIKPK
jgi:hypothetical protein